MRDVSSNLALGEARRKASWVQVLESLETRASGAETPEDSNMATEIRVPKIAAAATKASIGRWFKRVGDPVSLDEPLVEIETDNTTVEVAASVTGVLSGIHLTDGEMVESGALLGTITEYRSDTNAPGTP